MVMILFVVLGFLVGGYFLVSMVGPLVVGEGLSSMSILQTAINTTQAGSNLANSTAVAVEFATNFLGVIEVFVYFALIGLFLGYLIICFYARSYPFLAIFWVFAVIFLVIFSMILSNAYITTAESNSDINAFYETWGTNDLLMRYLPHLVGLFGIIGGIFLFVLIGKEPEAETQDI
jgi:hypothetical protein